MGDWHHQAACRQMPDESAKTATERAESFFPIGEGAAATRQANTAINEYCLPCPVRSDCLRDAPEYGIWGGMTEGERRKSARAAARMRNAARAWATANRRTIVDVELPELGDDQLTDVAETRALLLAAKESRGLADIAEVTGVPYETLRKITDRDEYGKVTAGVARRVADGLKTKVEA